jgi:hypothetical protein
MRPAATGLSSTTGNPLRRQLQKHFARMQEAAHAGAIGENLAGGRNSNHFMLLIGALRATRGWHRACRADHQARGPVDMAVLANASPLVPEQG